MASIPFTLAALATSAVPGLAVFGAREHETGEEFVSAVIASEDADLLVRVPRTQTSQVRQSAELLGMAALTEGPRSRLPFAVPEALGMTRAGDTRAVVTTYVDGDRFDAEDLAEDAMLLLPIARTVAAIHELPQSIAQNGGLPVRTAQDLRLRADRLIDRADGTRLLPETVRLRWKRVVEAAEVWDFAPQLVHGSLDADQLRLDDGEIIGVLGWSECSVGDPASDLAWLLAAGPDVLDAVLARYADLRDAPGSLGHLRTRAALYHELEVARWLLHGVESHDQDIIDDAVAMLDRMVGAGGPLGLAFERGRARAPMNEGEVSALLEETPQVVDHLSDTAAYEALDEDRMFGGDTEFVEPLTAADIDRGLGAGAEESGAAAEDTGAAAETADSSGSSDVRPSDPAASDASDASDDDQATRPIAPEDLPHPSDRPDDVAR
ncbi:2'-phosphotransferase [Leucobacter zeae]|nr:2'-phosphotransferase [Leucobacter zeae]